MFSPLKITFNLDGTGIYFDLSEPLHLDALIAWALVPSLGVKNDSLMRDDMPNDIDLPLDKWQFNNAWGWKASALFIEGEFFETIQYWRKKFRQNRVEITKGSPNLTMGAYREYNMPMPLLLCSKLIAYCVGDKDKITEALKYIKYIGKKTANGKGKVISIDVEEVETDYSLVKDNKAMRWLPKDKGIRLVRPRPPYWNISNRVYCCDVGEAY